MNNSKCKTCKWFDTTGMNSVELDDNDKRKTVNVFKRGKCRFKPPTAEGWPIVWENDWCSKWRLKIEKKRVVRVPAEYGNHFQPDAIGLSMNDVGQSPTPKILNRRVKNKERGK